MELEAYGHDKISIHALREEGDGRITEDNVPAKLFLSTPSARRATWSDRRTGSVKGISIHALREEGDAPEKVRGTLTHNFYPRPPRGGRRSLRRINGASHGFLSTPSARRATIRLPSAYPPLHISIHALREEGDGVHRLHPRGTQQFLSTPSARRATNRAEPYARHKNISIHALREEGDRRYTTSKPRIAISIHALREEGDSTTEPTAAKTARFLSTPSARRATPV